MKRNESGWFYENDDTIVLSINGDVLAINKYNRTTVFSIRLQTYFKESVYGCRTLSE